MSFVIYALAALQFAYTLIAIAGTQLGLFATLPSIPFAGATAALALARILQLLETADARHQAEQRAPAPKGELVTIYRMYDIRRAAGGVTAAGALFPDVDAAKAFIDKRDQGQA